MHPFLPGAHGEQFCPRCGAQVTQSDRYPAYLCGACEAMITDEAGAPVAGYNSGLTGGFMLRWPGGEHPDLLAGGAWVWIDGQRWWATEARFGGTLVLPESEGPDSQR